MFRWTNQSSGKRASQLSTFPSPQSLEKCGRLVHQNSEKTFLTGLSSADKKFPMCLWGWLLDQVYRTLILLHPSCTNPTLLAYNMLWATFDFNCTPMAPPWTKVVVHKKSGKRSSWELHGTKGWYIGPHMQGYQCYWVYITKTREERKSDTVEVNPQRLKVPYISVSDVISKPVANILKDLATAN